jgi:hypothetical protein
MKSGPWQLAALIALTALVPVPSHGQRQSSVLKSIDAVVKDGVTVVTLESDGPLPEPAPALLDSPPRIFFDLAGTTPRRQGATPGAGVVTRARVALRSANPKVTRVVLDLTGIESYRVSSSEREAGRLVIFVGTDASGAVAATVPPTTPPPGERAETKMLQTAIGDPSVPGLPPPVPIPPDTPPMSAAPTSPEPSSSAPAPSSTPHATPVPVPRSPVAPPEDSLRSPLPAAQAEVYRVQLAGALQGMVSHHMLLRSIDAGDPIAATTLTAALTHLRDLRRVLARVEPSSVVRRTHDLLIESCTLAATAVTLRMEAAADPSREGNASSAAAGALMLLEIVCASVGCANAPM